MSIETQDIRNMLQQIMLRLDRIETVLNMRPHLGPLTPPHPRMPFPSHPDQPVPPRGRDGPGLEHFDL